jgi:hypothetical protein
MQVICVAFSLAVFGNSGLEHDLPGMLERAVIGYSSNFFLENN